MKNQRKQSSFENFFNQPTPAKTAGLGFVLAIGVPQVLALLITIILLACNVMPTGEEKPDWYLYLSYTLTPVAFALALVCVWRNAKEPMKLMLNAKPCHWKYYVLALLLQFGLFSLATLNTYFLQFLGRFGYQDTPIELPSMDGLGLVGILFVVAVLPAIFEELIFRGVLLRGLKSFGTVGAVLLCGGLFSLYHQNPAQTIYQFCCGMAFALMALRAGSVFPTILSHFANNAAIILLTKFGVVNLPIWLIILCAVCLLATLAYLIFVENNNEKSGDKQEQKYFFLMALAGIFICVINWLAEIFQGFGG